MALRYLDGFEQYGSINIVPTRAENSFRLVSFNGNCTITSGVYRTIQPNSKSLVSNWKDCIATISVGTQADLIVGMGAYTTAVYADTFSFACFCSDQNWGPTTGIRIGRTANNAITVANPAGTILGTSANNVFPTASWFYIEIRVHFHATAGEVEIRVDGNATPVLNLTGINTAGGATGGFNYLLLSENGGNTYKDDLYICDLTGTVNNTFLGPLSVYTLYPTSDSAVQCTPSSGANNYSRVAEAVPDNDASYVSGSSSGLIDYYAVNTLPITPTSILGVAVYMVDKKIDNGSRGLRPRIRVGGTSTFGTTKNPANGSSYNSDFSIFELQPDGATAWTAAAVNSMNVGFESL